MARFLVILAVVFWSPFSSAQGPDTTSNESGNAITHPSATTAKSDVSNYAIRSEATDGLEKHYRRNELVLSRSVSGKNLYYIRGPRGLYASVIVNQITSPRIGLKPNVPVDIEIERIDKDTLKLLVADVDSGFIEAYILTPKSVSPVPAEEYGRLLAEWKNARAHLDSILKSLKEDATSESEAGK